MRRARARGGLLIDYSLLPREVGLQLADNAGGVGRLLLASATATTFTAYQRWYSALQPLIAAIECDGRTTPPSLFWLPFLVGSVAVRKIDVVKSVRCVALPTKRHDWLSAELAERARRNTELSR